ncbi:MAG: cupredoxin domain-containing protein [Planctomycetota bacterium]
MRPSTTTWVIVVAVAVLLAALAIFGFGRAGWWHGDHHGNGHARDHTGHIHDSSHDRHDTPDTPPGTSRPAPSGELIDGVRIVEVVARQFEFDPAVIVVQEGETVRLKGTSADLTHGMGIEAYDIDRPLEPDKTVTIEFTADIPGRHHVHCTVYCGPGHDDMHGELVVIPRD